jgi:hypothetical protein
MSLIRSAAQAKSTVAHTLASPSSALKSAPVQDVLRVPAALSDYVKPAPSDARVRLRNNALVLGALWTTTTLLPTPSPARALLVVALRRDVSDVVWVLSILGMCLACLTRSSFTGICEEVLMLAVLSLNMAQATFALRYPIKLPPASSMPSAALKRSPAPSPISRRLLASSSKVSFFRFHPLSSWYTVYVILRHSVFS